jgi:predicted unusual protein kinase regulating ubiquinone biosynthesis (AarF/ABC1/UbiB family)
MLMMARWLQAGRNLDDWLESMRRHLHNEIDYRREAELIARMAQLVGEAGGGAVGYRVPRLYPGFCSEAVLALEYMQGVPVTAPQVAALPLVRRNALALGMLELFFYELYDWGCMQTDPNFGNYLLGLDDKSGKRVRDTLVLLDFGSILDCTDEFLYHLRSIIDAGLRQDVSLLGDSLVGLGCLPEDASQEARQLFADFCVHLVEPLRPPAELPAEYLNARGQYCWGTSRLMHRAGKRAAASATSRHFTPPSREFALIARKLTGVFTFISVLEAEFNAYEMVAGHISRWRERERLGKG